MSIKGTRITNGYGDGGCGDENDTDVEDGDTDDDDDMMIVCTVEPRYNEVPRDWQNVFAITRFRYTVLFHIFYYYWGKENRSLYRGLRYIEVRYIEVPLY